MELVAAFTAAEARRVALYLDQSTLLKVDQTVVEEFLVLPQQQTDLCKLNGQATVEDLLLQGKASVVR